MSSFYPAGDEQVLDSPGSSSIHTPNPNTLSGQETSTAQKLQEIDESLITSSEIDRRPWNIGDIGRNSISALVNDPTRESSTSSLLYNSLTYAMKTKPGVQKSNFKSVKFRDFELYLNTIGHVYADYAEAKTNDLVTMNDCAFGPATGTSDRSYNSGSSSPAYSEDNSYLLNNQMASLETVPQVFFKDDFKLENPRIFDSIIAICENNVSDDTNDSLDRFTSQKLQDKLSHYLDIVEVHLVSEIAKRSAEFFTALSNIQSLQEKTRQFGERISTMKFKLEVLKQNQADRGLEIIELKQLRESLLKIHETMSTIQDIKSTQPTIQVLLNGGDYIGALDLISEANRLLDSPVVKADGTNSDETIKLTAVKGLMNISGQLEEMKKVICTLMQNDLVSLVSGEISQLKADLESGFKDYSEKTLKLLRSDQFEDGELSYFSTGLDVDETDFRGRMTPLVLGLLRLNSLKPAIAKLNDQLEVEIKNFCAKFYPTNSSTGSLDEIDSVSDSTLMKQFKTLTFNKYFETLEQVFSGILVLLKRIIWMNNTVYSIIVDAENQDYLHSEHSDIQMEDEVNSTEENQEPLAVSTGKAAYNIKSNLYSNFAKIAEFALTRSSKFIYLRRDQNSQLNLQDFTRLYNLVCKFDRAGEIASRKHCIGLRSILTNQSKAFMHQFHEEKMKQLVMLVENEQWLNADVPHDFQVMLDKIVNAEEYSSTTSSSSIKEDDQKSSVANSTSYLLIDETTYQMVPCSLMFVKMISDYLHCIESIDLLRIETLNKLIELTQCFNEKICTMIIGGVAVRNGVLKRITAKHLSLVEQSLSFLLALTPIVKLRISGAFPDKQKVLVNNMDRIMLDSKKNRQEVKKKLLSIMNDLLKAHCKILKVRF